MLGIRTPKLKIPGTRKPRVNEMAGLYGYIGVTGRKKETKRQDKKPLSAGRGGKHYSEGSKYSQFS